MYATWLTAIYTLLQNNPKRFPDIGTEAPTVIPPRIRAGRMKSFALTGTFTAYPVMVHACILLNSATTKSAGKKDQPPVAKLYKDLNGETKIRV